MGSISYHPVDLRKATRLSTRIAIGTVLEKTSFRFPGSPEHAPQPEGAALSCLRVRVERTIKGPVAGAGAELRIFCPMEWFQHTHAEALKGGVISYADTSYEDGLAPDQIGAGAPVLIYLGDDPAPPGFPPGTAFLRVRGALDRADREKDVVAALREAP